MASPRNWKAFAWLLTLRGRLVFGLALTWLAIVALVLAMAWYLGQTMLQQSNMAHLSYESSMLADEISQQMDARINALERVASTLSVEDSGAQAEQVLAENDVLLEWFEGLLVADANGVVIADWPILDNRIGLESAGTEFFRMLKGSRKAYVSEPFVGPVSQYPMVIVGIPRLDEDKHFVGYVGGIVSLKTSGLFSRLARMQPSPGNYVAVMTASGKLLYHPRRQKIMDDVPPPADNPWLNQALDGWQGQAVGSLIDGEHGLQSYGQVWSAGWVVGRFLTMEEAQTPLAGYIQTLWWAWLLLAILMMPLLWWILGRMLRPLRQLECQIGEVGLGRRSKVTLMTSMCELRDVSLTFNRVEDERQLLLTSLQEREAFLDSVLNATPQGMFVANFDGDITYMNPALLDMLGISATMPMSAWLQQVHADDRQGAIDMWRHSLKTHRDFIRQLRFVRADDETLWLDVHARVVMVSRDEQSLGMVGVVKDITARREQEALQRWEAEHDPLTGLLNRRGFERRLEEAFAEYQKTSTPSALLLFDLDHFKPINDEGGHALGDEMLRRIAQVVAWEVRRSDHVARQGGDEFGVLLPSCTLNQASTIADSLRKAVSEISVTHQGKEYTVTLSIGVTAFDEDDHTIQQAMARADAASYEAKGEGRNALIVRMPGKPDMEALFD
ncbi:diguanylate cyclase [Vreelandella azerica]|nr:diguanylate cyclase [Halomonas azerica]